MKNFRHVYFIKYLVLFKNLILVYLSSFVLTIIKILMKTETKLLSLAFGMSLANVFCQVNLDANQVNAAIEGPNKFFHKSGSQSAGYEFPKNSNKNLLYFASFWYGGIDSDDTLHLAAGHFDPDLDISFGPISSTNDYSNPLYIQKYGQSMWKVLKSDVDYHINHFSDQNYIIPNSILNWPGNGDVNLGVSSKLAPFFDQDEDGVYEPNNGDYPLIKGDEAVYVVTNDYALPHSESNGEKIGIEIHLMFYQFNQIGSIGTTTFVSQKIINKGSEQYHDFLTSFFVDGDIGLSLDDYFGTDSTRNLMFFYNGDIYDDIYQDSIPVLGVKTLNKNMYSSMYYTNNYSVYPFSDPISAVQYYFAMNAKWSNGTHLTNDGLYGRSPNGPNTNFAFSGTLSSGWSEISAMSNKGDRRGVSSVYIGDFNPNDTVDVDYAIVIGLDSTIELGYENLLTNSDSIQAMYNNGLCSYYTSSLGIEPLILNQINAYPIPADNMINIDLDRSFEHVEISLYSVEGKEMYNKIYSNTSKIDINGLELKGIFNLKIKTNMGEINRKVLFK